jgi:hypothetical protein
MFLYYYYPTAFRIENNNKKKYLVLLFGTFCSSFYFDLFPKTQEEG